MAVILHIETSSKLCSVALSREGNVLFSKMSDDGPSHAVLLGRFVDEALSYAESESLRPDAVAVSSGPGSYTGLRIGVSLAKGVAYGMGIRLIFVPTLRVLAQALEGQTPAGALLCPMLDARRMEVYTALYNSQLQEVAPVRALVVEAGSFDSVPADTPLYIFGDGAAKCREVLAHPCLNYVDGLVPRADLMVEAAEAAFEAGQFQDVAYSEPFYLKEFQATVPQKLEKIIHRENQSRQ